MALATVIETWGSAPRPVGSHLVIDGEGNFHGSVSGGCVEGAVITEAMDVIGSGSARMLEFGVADETAWRWVSPAVAVSASMSRRLPDALRYPETAERRQARPPGRHPRDRSGHW